MNIGLRSILLNIHVITNKCSIFSACFKLVSTKQTSRHLSIYKILLNLSLFINTITGKTISKLPWKSKPSLQRNGMAAIPKIAYWMRACELSLSFYIQIFILRATIFGFLAVKLLPKNKSGWDSPCSVTAFSPCSVFQ